MRVIPVVGPWSWGAQEARADGSGRSGKAMPERVGGTSSGSRREHGRRPSQDKQERAGVRKERSCWGEGLKAVVL